MLVYCTSVQYVLVYWIESTVSTQNILVHVHIIVDYNYNYCIPK